MKTPEEIPGHHWADQAAEALIEKHPQKETFVCASGISPSGFVHIGNFREVITVDLVVKALQKRGKKTRFIYSWDDYDAFRKVPANMPEQELLKKDLRKPISKVTDPFHQDKSYAAHFEKRFEESLVPLEIVPSFIRQNEPYQRGDYAEGIKHAYNHQNEIVEILNKSRTEPLPSDWTCLSIFCKSCERDATTLKAFDTTSGKVSYSCKICKSDFETNVNEANSGVKLLWRVDWPMRWAKEGVDFEPGGKDHSSEGGSFDTGAEIIRKVWKKEPPHYVQYDFVVIKGAGGKLSSSSGQLITLDEALEIYEPSIVRWIFASRKPNVDFAIAFDLDVIRTYDDFDRSCRIALKQEEAEEKRFTYERRIYELSRTGPYPKEAKAGGFPEFSFRHLCNILQIHQGNVNQAKGFYQDSFTCPEDELRFKMRAERAWNWIQKHAPDDFKFLLNSKVTYKSQYPLAIQELIALLESSEYSTFNEETLPTRIFTIMKSHGIEAKLFFADVYQILISKSSGPKLASFLLALGQKKSVELLKQAL